MAIEYIERPPRIQPELPFGEIELPKPPTAEKNSATTLISTLLPIISVAGFLFTTGTGNVAMMIPMALAVVASVGVSLYQSAKDKKEQASKEKAYRALLLQMRQDMERSHSTQRIYYHYNYPSIETVLDIAARKETSRFGSRLWERRSTDSDFGAVRLGVGSRPSTVIYKTSGGEEVDESPLMKDARRLAEDSRVLTDAPVSVPLKPYMAPGQTETTIPARHSIGIYGKNTTNVSDYARAMLASYMAFHSSQDTRVYAIGYPQAHAGWEWAEWMPHCFTRNIGDDEDSRPKEYDQLCFAGEKEKVAAFWRRIKKELDQRQIRLRDTGDKEKKTDVTLPFLVVVVDILGDMPADSPLKDVAAEAAVATILKSGPVLGAAVIFLANDAAHVPSDCLAMVEAASVGERVVFRYTEVGMNSPRYLGDADQLNTADAKQKFAALLRRLDLVRPFGADVPRSVTMLQMESVVEQTKIDTIDKIPYKEHWEHSLVPKNQEWLSVPLGMLSMKDVRTLVFSAKEGGDGVHGMIAGTTGSGKSELLMTMIAGLAVKYDPRIVNFVLVDYKGGSAFEPFRKLPHVVDILTNLQGSAVERMFVAIQAVMEQRASLLAKSGVSDLVKYRSDVAPRLKPDDPRPRTFPHLFIVVDEFAEMITANPEYKRQFESITRLGRSFGVTLILATQRPAGVVSDQMRANMKFRICLRVETPDDSKELLSSPDAAFLPNIGGRGYIQSGNELMTTIQVAWAGGSYSDDRTVALKDVIWLDDEVLPTAKSSDAPKYSATEVAEALGMKPGETPKTVLDWMVGVAAIRAQREDVPKQTKPWPEPLPEFLSLTSPVDARFLNTERTTVDGAVVINENVSTWLDNNDEKPLWKPYDWKNPLPLTAEIGFVDNPYKAEQRILKLDVSGEPIVLLRGAGRGKKVFLKTLLVALGAQRSPDSLHMYAFDFGRGGLKAVSALPHLGAAVDASEAARVEQLMRMLRNFINERQERLAKYASLADHNAKNPQNVLPEIVVVVENFAEFKESYEHLLPEFMALVRDGRAFGMYFIVTATVINDLPGKLFTLFTQRLTLTQNDRAQYSEIVGPGARNFDNVPGRGLIAIAIKEGEKPLPLEFQIGMPGRQDVAVPGSDQIDPYQLLSQRMERVWTAMGGKRPSAELPRSLTLLDMFELADAKPVKKISDLDIIGKWQRSMQPANQEWLRAWLGLISSKDLRMMVFQAQADGVHGMAAGTTGSGKSEMLQTLIAAMAIRYDPRIVNFVLIDYKGGPTIEPFRKLPHVVDMATNLQGNAVERIFIAINAEMNRRSDILAKAGVSDLVEYRKKVIPSLKPDSPLPLTFPHLFIIVDEFAEMVSQNPEYKQKFESITRLGRSFGVSLLLATQRPTGVVTDQMRANMKFRIALRMETPEDSKELLKKPDAARLPQIAGRGYVQAGTDLLTEVQVAWSGAPYNQFDSDPAYPSNEVLVALEKVGDPPRSLLGWLVGTLAAEAKKQNIPKQFKPWPDPLPEKLPINQPVDASYLPEMKEDSIVLSPALASWAGEELTVPADFIKHGLWQPHNWESPLPMKVAIGLADDPFHSSQRRLIVDMGGDPIVVFGSSGRGKSTLVKSLLFALAAVRSPSEVNIYLLDFGRGGLRAVSRMPHCGASIDASQPDRVAALFRMVRGLMNERQDRLSHYASLADYNAQHKDNPEVMFPSVVIAIDNFAEFRENYESMFGDLITLVRDGRQFGIYFVITANQLSDVPTKLYNLFGQRLTFTLADATAYSEIVGKGALSLMNVPGRGLINLDGQPLEFHIATPVMGAEKDPFTRIAERMDTAWAAAGGKRPSAEIPKAITLLEMMQLAKGKRMDRIGDLDIAANWQRSMQQANQEWLSAPLGLISSKEIRTMIFNAKAGGDGVHGMAAGTTGSGKSEMLQTLIASLCIKYDPRIVNFVLIDYKGGPTIEPFRKLPHAVDLATNLEGNAVERIFTAINAEMNRRSDILAKAGVADLVDYRKKVIPSLKPDSPFPRTFPHLFIIVDEFAEMVMQNPDYKQKFESITRLGRSFGVSLLLATQRPTGAVTDQMRANMKYRLALRVETTDDSKEMIGCPDAATLPAIPGRGYVQVGGGNMMEIQVAYSGAPYDDTRPDPQYKTEEILDALETTDPPRSLLGWLVGVMAVEAKRQNIAKQFKPWPSPLPEKLPMNLPVNAEYIQKGKLGNEIVINPAVAAWMTDEDAQPLWEAHDWTKPLPVNANIGIIDNTHLAEQRLLNVDLTGDPLIVFGASGRGKTTFVKSLLIALAAQHRPDELHIYILDFGRGGLKALRALPHVGGIVETNEEERVERFMRMIRNFIDDRQQRLQAYDSLDDYNAKNPQNPMQAIVVVVDNAIEFRESYDKYLPDIMSLVRDGRSFGVYFVLTASLLGDISGKLFSLLNQRITFAQSDPLDYMTIIGRGSPRINDVPGRGICTGLVDDKPTPLEFHTGIPLSSDPADQVDYYRILVQRMATAWGKLESEDASLKQKRARPVEPLAKFVEIANLLPPLGHGGVRISVPLGINDLDREALMVELAAKGPHWIIMGPPVTGKTTTMRALTLALAHCYSPEQVALILIDPSDPSRRFYNFGVDGTSTSADGSIDPSTRLDNLPHVLATVSTAKEMDEVAKRLRAEYDEEVIGRLQGHPDVFQAQNNQRRHIFVLVDHYDDIEPLNRGNRPLASLNEIGKGKNLHLVLCGTINGMRGGMDELRKRAESSRYSYVFSDFEAVRYMGIRASFSLNKELPPGRGFMVKAVSAAMVQMAMPFVEGRAGSDAQYAQLVRAIKGAYPTGARWSYFASDLTALNAAIKGEAEPQQGVPSAPAVGAAIATAVTSVQPAEQAPDWQKELETLMASIPKLEDVGKADPSRMVSVVIGKKPAGAEAPGNGAVPAGGNETVPDHQDGAAGTGASGDGKTPNESHHLDGLSDGDTKQTDKK